MVNSTGIDFYSPPAPSTWAQMMDKAADKLKLIDLDTVCCICQKGTFEHTWMVCPTCTRPVAHTDCIREYLRLSDFGVKRCPVCRTASLSQRDGHRTNFPEHWDCVMVLPIQESEATDTTSVIEVDSQGNEIISLD